MLPEEFVFDFEKRFVRPHGHTTKEKIRRRFLRWRAAQKMIVAVGLEPTDWFYHAHDVYDYFHANQLSLGYMASILKLANLWGNFICRKFRKPFNPVPLPKGYERQRLLEAFYSKESRNRTPSGPLTPEALASTRGRLNQPRRSMEADSHIGRVSTFHIEEFTKLSISNGRSPIQTLTNNQL